MSTFMAKPKQVPQRWFVIDATDQVVGRLAVQIANILRGKHRPEYTPHIDTGEFVIVVNAEKVRFTGKKMETQDLPLVHALPRRPEDRDRPRVDRDAPRAHPARRRCRRMVPRNKLGRQQMTKLKIYAGPTTRTRPSSRRNSSWSHLIIQGRLIDRGRRRKRRPTQYYLGTGRRKTSVARVRLTEGTGKIPSTAGRSKTTSPRTRTATPSSARST